MPHPYHIKPEYKIRQDNDYDPEIIITDDYQDEVYLAGHKLMEDNGLTSILDLGCGRAFKLIKYFSESKTLGLDLSLTVEWLQSEEGYPDKDWKYIPLDSSAPKGYDIVI